MQANSSSLPSPGQFLWALAHPTPVPSILLIDMRLLFLGFPVLPLRPLPNDMLKVCSSSHVQVLILVLWLIRLILPTVRESPQHETTQTVYVDCSERLWKSVFSPLPAGSVHSTLRDSSQAHLIPQQAWLLGPAP